MFVTKSKYNKALNENAILQAHLDKANATVRLYQKKFGKLEVEFDADTQANKDKAEMEAEIKKSKKAKTAPELPQKLDRSPIAVEYRKSEAIRLQSEGKNAKEIAEELNISVSTARNYLKG